jgi:hypothetical protein
MNDDEWWVWPVMAVLGLIGLVKLWQSTVRPWIEQTWTEVTAGDALVTLPGVGALDDTDLIGLGLVALVFLALVVSAARGVRRRRLERAAAEGQDTEAPRSKPKTKRGFW